jgi:serine/threonine protein kinase
MPWIDGRTLDRFVKDNLSAPNKIDKIAADFSNIVLKLKKLKIAHGDLQHGNILVTNSGLKLIDYDCLFCSATKSFATNEIGMPNYQHPKRKAADVGEDIDDFSAWIIYISLKIIAKDKSYFNNNDTLIFEKSDLEFPKKSRTIKSIAQHKDTEVRAFGGFIVHSLLASNVQAVPKFDLSTNPVSVGSNQVPNDSWWIESRPSSAEAGNSDWVKDWLKKN